MLEAFYVFIDIQVFIFCFPFELFMFSSWISNSLEGDMSFALIVLSFPIGSMYGRYVPIPVSASHVVVVCHQLT